MMVTDTVGRIIEINPAFTRVTGWTREDVLGKDSSLLLSDRRDRSFYQDMPESLRTSGAWQGEIRNRRKSGEIFPDHLVINAIADDHGKISHYVAAYANISASGKEREELVRLAYHDFLTGLPNRALFADRFTQAISLGRRAEKNLAVLLIDLDHFKAINDSSGHEAGDLMLQSVAKAMTNSVRASDSVARLGGDEFAILLQNVTGPDMAIRLTSRIYAAVTQPFDIFGQETRVGASIGIGLFPDHGETPEALIQQADQAMYAVKQSDRDGWRLCDEETAL